MTDVVNDLSRAAIAGGVLAAIGGALGLAVAIVAGRLWLVTGSVWAALVMVAAVTAAVYAGLVYHGRR